VTEQDKTVGGEEARACDVRMSQDFPTWHGASTALGLSASGLPVFDRRACDLSTIDRLRKERLMAMRRPGGRSRSAAMAIDPSSRVGNLLTMGHHAREPPPSDCVVRHAKFDAD
jgi:hypothetical protein